jgi:hypothetical protein
MANKNLLKSLVSSPKEKNDLTWINGCFFQIVLDVEKKHNEVSRFLHPFLMKIVLSINATCFSIMSSKLSTPRYISLSSSSWFLFLVLVDDTGKKLRFWF